MKKISNISELKAEQLRLKEQDRLLENNIRENWQEIRESLTPNNITRQVFSAVFSKPEPGDGKTILNYLAGFAATALAGSVLKRLKKKVAGWFA